MKKFLNRGIEQLLAQTYEDHEIILIDDGSTDGSGTLCDQWTINDERIKVIHKTNGGLGSARNAGFDIARGKYIWSMDMDDEIEPDVLEHLHIYAEDTKAEVLCFGYIEEDYSTKVKNSYEFERISCKSNDEVKQIYVDLLLGLKCNNGFFWNKLYRRDFIEKNHLRFGNEYIQQDELFNLKVYKCVEHLELIPGIYYHYYVYGSGNNRARYIPNRFDIYATIRTEFLNLYNAWNLTDQRMLIFVYRRFFFDVLVVLHFNAFHPQADTTHRQQYIKNVLDSELTRDCIRQLKQLSCVPNGLYNKINYWAIEKQSYLLLLFSHYMGFFFDLCRKHLSCLKVIFR